MEPGISGEMVTSEITTKASINKYLSKSENCSFLNRNLTWYDYWAMWKQTIPELMNHPEDFQRNSLYLSPQQNSPEHLEKKMI